MAYSTRSQLHMLHYRFDEAIDWGLRAISLADQLGEVETRVHALNNVGTALLFADRPGGRERMEESLALALEHGFHDHAARAYTNFAEYAVVFKDFALAERLLAEGIAFATRHDLDSAAQYLLGRQAQLRMEQGRFREAETIAQGVMSLERLPMVMHLPALTVLGRVRVRLGEPDGRGLLQQALQEGLPTGEPQRIVPVRLALAEAAWLAEDLGASHEQLAALAAMDLDNFRSLGHRRTGGLVAAHAGWRGRCRSRRRGSRRREPPSSAAIRWPPRRNGSRLGLPYEAALALMQVRGAEAGTALARAVTMLRGDRSAPRCGAGAQAGAADWASRTSCRKRGAGRMRPPAIIRSV